MEFQSQTDAILGWVGQDGRAFMMDTWISGYTQPLIDKSQDINNIRGRIVDGVTTLSFTRKRTTKDTNVRFTTNRGLGHERKRFCFSGLIVYRWKVSLHDVPQQGRVVQCGKQENSKAWTCSGDFTRKDLHTVLWRWNGYVLKSK